MVRDRPLPSPAKAAVGALGIVLAMSGCGATTVPAGEADPTDPLCASVMTSLPDQLLGHERTETTSQSTAAWGSGETTIVLRCGVTPPPPTTDLCTTIESRGGVQIDWIVQEQEELGTVLYTTYGRRPAIDISVPRAAAPDQPSAAALEVASVVERIPQKERCLDFADVDGTDG